VLGNGDFPRFVWAPAFQYSKIPWAAAVEATASIRAMRQIRRMSDVSADSRAA
jgi:hypothetical protein